MAAEAVEKRVLKVIEEGIGGQRLGDTADRNSAPLDDESDGGEADMKTRQVLCMLHLILDRLRQDLIDWTTGSL